MFRRIPVTLLLLLQILLCQTRVSSAQAFKLPPLPYEYTALEPYLGKRTLELHHDKHHAKYIYKLNKIIREMPNADTTEWLEKSTLTEIVKASYGRNQGLFNNAAQSWNHEFFWKCMTGNYQEPPAGLLAQMEKDFGSFEKFKEVFSTAGNQAFGSGWAWLFYDATTDELVVERMIGADNPMAMDDNWTPLLALDVWEHAYYLDYLNMRPTYVETFVEKLANWEFVAENLQAAKLEAASKLESQQEADETCDAETCGTQ